MTESSINILIPYSREYVSNTYKISDPDILYIIENRNDIIFRDLKK